MMGWLYRYIFRGWGLLLVVAMITILWLDWQSVHSQSQNSAKHAVTARPTTPAVGAPTSTRR
jgi:hypothetical protein